MRMADIKQEHKGEDVDNYGMGNSTDPKNMQELTQYVSLRFLFCSCPSFFAVKCVLSNADNVFGVTDLLGLQVQTLLQNMQDKFQTMSDQIIGRNILFDS